MVLAHALLGLLAGREMSGYDLTKLFEENLGSVWTAKHSQIYPELARLQAQGWIEQSETGPRGRKTYKITEAGLAEVRHWLRETKPARQQANEALLRASFLWLLAPEEAREYLLEEKTLHQRQVEQLQRVATQLAASPWAGRPRARSMTAVLEARLRYEKAMAEWAEWAMTQFASEDESGE